MDGKSNIWFILGFITVILAFTLIRISLLNQKNFLTHDESISLLSISGTEGDYEKLIEAQKDSLYASQIQELSRPNQISFYQINQDLIENDIHPPAYFYAIGKLFEFIKPKSPISFIYFNLILHIVSAILVVLISCFFLNLRNALLVGVIFSSSPAVFQNYFELRHYPLFEISYLMHLLSILFLIKTNPKKWLFSISIFLAVFSFLVCTFTHFYAFIIPISIGSYFLLKKNWKKLGNIFILYGATYVLTFVISLQYISPILNKLGSASKEKSNSIIELAWAFTLSIFRFFTEKHTLVLLILTISILIIIAMRKFVWNFIKSNSLACLLLLTPLLINALLYSLGITPRHALGYEYLCLVWPGLSLVCVLLFKNNPLVIASVIVLMTASSLRSSFTVKRYILTVPEELKEVLGKQDVIYVSNFKRGFLPRLSEFLAPECLIVNSQDANLERFKVNVTAESDIDLKIDEITFISNSQP